MRAIRWAKGFGLLFVQCSPAQGEELIARVCDDVTDKAIDVLRLEGEVDNLYETVAALPKVDKTNVLFITGLEKSLVPYIKPGYGSEGDYYAKDTVPKILGKLNLQREKFRETLKLCFVFLVPPYAMKYLIRRAADFFDWRSGIWEFVGPLEELQQEAYRLLKDNDFERYLNLTPQQRCERFLAIEDLLEHNDGSAENVSELLREQGRLLDADGNHKKAINYFDAALKVKPSYPEALNSKGIVLNDLGHHEEAIICYDTALAIKSNYHHALTNKGDALDDLGKYEEAITCYDAALVLKPDHVHALGNKGFMLSKLGRYEEAVAHHDAALAIQPDYHYAPQGKGEAFESLGKYEEAIACYDAALTIKPDFHYALNNKGVVLGKLGRYEEAIGCYDAALAIQPEDHEALNNKGITLRNLGRYEEAILCYEAALAIKPDYQLALDNKEEALEKLADASH
ncbi:tetratricopeptide repeat protein [Nodosilinea sp. FACHB-131]|uniref:tetratricopeptide repeat protein n=1 Tax=Cyanophyceae TaxID=3028117 RepID=UPI001688A614|nr:tetratricopeptide repeat protein [Nodosilinea sp. FACHB-131]